MSRVIQIRRGTATQHSGFTGAIGEITMDTTNKTLCVHDGETVGGTPLARADELVPDTADYVIETYRAPNRQSWYRRYKSGWVEQGGCAAGIYNAETETFSITMPIPLADGYHFSVTARSNSVGYYATNSSTHNTNAAIAYTISRTIYEVIADNPICYWNACGFAE